MLSAIACIFAGLCYAEFASLAPVSGSAYTYSYVALGEIFAWIIGWDLLLEFGVSMSAVAVGWSGYVTNLLSDLGIHLPKILTNDIAHGGIINLPAIFIIALLGWILTRGIRESSNFSNIMVFIKLAVIILFIVLAAPHIKPQNWTPFAPYGWKNVITAAGLVFLHMVVLMLSLLPRKKPKSAEEHSYWSCSFFDNSCYFICYCMSCTYWCCKL